MEKHFDRWPGINNACSGCIWYALAPGRVELPHLLWSRAAKGCTPSCSNAVVASTRAAATLLLATPGTRLLYRLAFCHSQTLCLAPTADEEDSEELLSEDGTQAQEEEVLEGPRVEHGPGDGFDPDMIPGINTGDDVVEFYGKFGQDSAVKFFYCNRCDGYG